MTGTTSTRWRGEVPLALVPMGAAVLWRGSLIGRPPFTDDGWSVCAAWFARHGLEPIAHAPLAVLARVLAPLVQAGAGGFVAMRAAEGVLACLAAAAVYALLRRCSGRAVALVGATLWALAVNHPRFVDAGFKNAIHAAMLPLAWALFVALGSRVTRGGWALAGVLGGMACLLREAFVPMALVVGAIAIARGGVRGAAWCAAGGIAAGVVGIVAVGALGPGVGVLPGAIVDHASALAALGASAGVPTGPRMSVFVDALRAMGWVVAWAAVPALACAVPGLRRADASVRAGLLVGGGLLLAPWPEMLAKLVFPYHLAVLGLGLAVVGVTAFSALRPGRVRAVVVVIAAAACAWGVSVAWTNARWSWGEHARWGAVMVGGASDPAVEADSFYLRLASIVREHAGPEGRVLTSGLYFAAFPLGGVLPVDGLAADATFIGLLPTAARERALAALRASPPRVVVESGRFPLDLSAMVPDFPSGYRLVAEIPKGACASYGQFDARVYVRR